ncbi:MAG: hypothetical protein FOGNACKC_01205 [Anaerolineae bacterium]|nr:hypothetical protein [Anaerolineae bacterium]
MLEDLLVENLWISLTVWALLFISDYYFTIYGAYLYQTYAKQYVVYEGSYELTPSFQNDVNNLRRVSPRFLVSLSLTIIFLIILWFLSVKFLETPWLFSFLIGALILSEVAIHIRHVRNIYLFGLTRKTKNGLKGHIEYRRWVILKSSAIELTSFSALFLLGFLISNSWFFLGGAVRCLMLGLSHLRLARKSSTNN